MGVGCREADEEGQSVRVRQDVHLGTRFAPVHGARTCVFAPFLALTWALSRTTRVTSRRDDAGDVEEAGVVELMQHGLVQPPPYPGPRPDQKPAVSGRLRDTKAGRQCPPGTPADQHVDDGREHCLIRRVLRSTALRPHPQGWDERLRDLPQTLRNDPTPRTLPHAQLNESTPHRTRSNTATTGRNRGWVWSLILV